MFILTKSSSDCIKIYAFAYTNKNCLKTNLSQICHRISSVLFNHSKVILTSHLSVLWYMVVTRKPHWMQSQDDSSNVIVAWGYSLKIPFIRYQNPCVAFMIISAYLRRYMPQHYYITCRECLNISWYAPGPIIAYRCACHYHYKLT